MSISFFCPSCMKKIKCDERMAGRKAKCPHCKSEFYVPQQPSQSAPPPPSATRTQQKMSSSLPSSRKPFANIGSAPEEGSSDGDMIQRRADERPSSGLALGMGISSLVLGILNLPAATCLGWCCFLFGFLTLPLSAVGAILGIVGIMVPLFTGKRGIGLPIAGTTLNVIAIVSVFVWPFIAAAFISKVPTLPAPSAQNILPPPPRKDKNPIKPAKQPPKEDTKKHETPPPKKDTKKHETPPPPIDKNKVVKEIELGEATYQIANCQRADEGIVVEIHATNHKAKKNVFYQGTLVDDAGETHRSTSGGGFVDLPYETKVKLRIGFRTVVPKVRKLQTLTVHINSLNGEFRNLEIEEKPIRVVLFTVLGGGQVSETVEIEIGGHKVSWDLSLSKSKTETAVNLPAAGKYSYKIKAKATHLVKGVQVPYQASGQGNLDLIDGERILYFRQNLNATTHKYDVILKKP